MDSGACEGQKETTPEITAQDRNSHRGRAEVHDRVISYAEALLKARSESIEATLRKRRILFAGFVARMEDTRLPKCVMFRELVGGQSPRMGQEEEWMVCLLEDLRVFGIKTEQWMIAVHDTGESRKQ